MLHGSGGGWERVYWLEFALTICSAWPGHKFTAHLLCNFVSLSLSLCWYLAVKQLYTIWNYTLNTQTYTHIYTLCHHLFINLLFFTSSWPDRGLLLFMELITELRWRDLYSSCICISHSASSYIIGSCILMSFLFWTKPLAKHYKLNELISSSNTSELFLLCLFINTWSSYVKGIFSLKSLFNCRIYAHFIAKNNSTARR